MASGKMTAMVYEGSSGYIVNLTLDGNLIESASFPPGASGCSAAFARRDQMLQVIESVKRICGAKGA